MVKRIVILGSTGSIGRQTIDVIKRNRNAFDVVGLSAHKNIGLLEEQIRELNPIAVAISNERAAENLRARIERKIEILVGEGGIQELAAMPEGDLVVNALVGSIGLDPTISALKLKKTLALANKESMVVGGEIVTKLAARGETQIIPIDSEHNAIFQCLQGEDLKDVVRIILTGSGGPFRGCKLEDLKDVTVEEALAHPRWKMGPKISIDSATLMNKGLETIEAHFLFGIDYNAIEVIIHPQSIIHSMVEFRDGSIKAHLGQTDMRIPIQYALSHPERLPSPLPSLDFSEIKELTFEKPDIINFPCLKYALEAGKKGKTFPAVLNAANEEAVNAFLNRKISFPAIPHVIREVLDSHTSLEVKDIGVLKEAENWARQRAKSIIQKLT
ncbi:MAG: 1-deoxy-D-xylulose-5-phosphate reductoisomerase [Actinomycetota bacterium]|nr:1-deoxy-D-xylulose-5-phosphate reductoisomerase [Actinomycetota bacterium]